MWAAEMHLNVSIAEIHSVLSGPGQSGHFIT